MNRQFGAFTGIAMILIVLNHAITFSLEAHARNGFPEIGEGLLISLSILQAIGIFAVPIFFFISGSFVSYAAQGDPPRLSSKFIGSSLRHILIPYIIWSIIFSMVVYFQHHEVYSLSGYIKNILVGYPYHFIPLLITYYILSPLLVIIVKKYSLPLLILIGAYQLFTAMALASSNLGIGFPAWTSRLLLPVLRTTFADWGIYFPLGLIYGFQAKKIVPWLKNWRWILIGLTVIFFIFGVFEANHQINFPYARLFVQTTFVLIIPVIPRDQIPWVRQFEKVGKRSYGLYLTHLIILNLTVWLLQILVPKIISLPLVVVPLLFVIGFIIPLGVMEYASRSPGRKYYRFIFG